MATIKEVVDEATTAALGDGCYGAFADRSRDMKQTLIRKAKEAGYSEKDVENHVGMDIGDYCDQQYDSIWPHDAGDSH